MKKNLFQTASIFCYCLSLVLPTFLSDDEIGFYFLLNGWIALANPIGPIYLFGLPWLANFLYVLNLSIVNRANVLIQIAISIISIIFTLFLFLDVESQELAMDMDIGFWFWILSFVTLMIGQFVILFESNEKNLISDYQEKWVDDFIEIKRILLETNSNTSINIEHVGSTSISGLKAKPIIDIDIVYNSQSDFESIKSNFESIGYYHNGNQGIEGREVFKRTSDQNHELLDNIAHHLYVCHEDSEELNKHLLFRDHLRSNENARKEYEKIKLKLAQKANQDKKTYAILKENEATQFVQDCIKNEIENGN